MDIVLDEARALLSDYQDEELMPELCAGARERQEVERRQNQIIADLKHAHGLSHDRAVAFFVAALRERRQERGQAC